MLGFFSFTEVTDPDGHEAYNAWHQLDHLPEQFTIDGISFGQRWVCSPRCVDQRLAVSPLLARCHYMTLYLMRDAEVVPEFAALARRLRAEGRFFGARQSHLSGPFEVVGRWSAPQVEVSPAALPFRPSEGVYVAVGPPLDGSRRTQMLEVPGVAGAWQFAETARPEEAGRQITVVFVEEGLWAAAERLDPLWTGGEGPLEWAGPLERVDPGDWVWFR
jgi:hypothetical protein